MITIRLAKLDEVKKLQDLNHEVFLDNAKYDDDLDITWAKSEKGHKYFTDLLNNPQACCLIAEEDNEAVGYLAASPRAFDYCKSKYLEIENMGVNPSHRSKGVGSLLIQKYLEVAKAKGYKKGYVNAYFANTRGIEFYKKNGFKESDISLDINL